MMKQVAGTHELKLAQENKVPSFGHHGLEHHELKLSQDSVPAAIESNSRAPSLLPRVVCGCFQHWSLDEGQEARLSETVF